jgi:hypothetical protein
MGVRLNAGGGLDRRISGGAATGWPSSLNFESALIIRESAYRFRRERFGDGLYGLHEGETEEKSPAAATSRHTNRQTDRGDRKLP